MVEHDSCPATLTHASLPYQPTPWYYARIFYFHGLPDPSISFSNNEQIFSRESPLPLMPVKLRVDLILL
jgi:hypothetical protein